MEGLNGVGGAADDTPSLAPGVDIGGPEQRSSQLSYQFGLPLDTKPDGAQVPWLQTEIDETSGLSGGLTATGWEHRAVVVGGDESMVDKGIELIVGEPAGAEKVGSGDRFTLDLEWVLLPRLGQIDVVGILPTLPEG